MNKQKSAAIILIFIIIFGSTIIPSCSVFANKEQAPFIQSAPNAALIDNDARNNLVSTLTSTGQQAPFCVMRNMSIPDRGMGTLRDLFSVRDTGMINDLDVYLNIQHPYVGDLEVTLEHSGGLGSAIIINELGCGASDIDVIINDQGPDGNVLEQCDNAPAIHGNRIGGNPAGPVLGIFNGNDFSGDWVLTINDNISGDVGTLVQWCLIPTFLPSCHELTLSHTGLGSNPLASPANSASCPLGHYMAGERISLTNAFPDPGWVIGSWSNTDNDTSTANTNTVTMPDSTLMASVNYMGINACIDGTFIFTGRDPLTGAAGNIQNFSINGINVNVSGWNNNISTGSFTPAYVGVYPAGLGFSDLDNDGQGLSNENNPDDSRVGNYLLFEFDRPITLDQIYLGDIADNNDLTMWLGNAPGGINPYSNHQTLSRDFLDQLISETDLNNVSENWVDINEGRQIGNILVVTADTNDDTSDDMNDDSRDDTNDNTDGINDYIKIRKLTMTCSNCTGGDDQCDNDDFNDDINDDPSDDINDDLSDDVNDNHP